MTKLRLPTHEQVGTMIGDLIGHKVEPKPVDPLRWIMPQASCGCVYLTSDKQFGAGAIVDTEFLIISGGALTMTAPKAVEEAIKEGRIEGHIYEAFCEILNISAGLLNDVSPTHVVLGDVFRMKTMTPDDAKAFLSNPDNRVDTEITVPKYGTGRIAFLRPAG